MCVCVCVQLSACDIDVVLMAYLCRPFYNIPVFPTLTVE